MVEEARVHDAVTVELEVIVIGAVGQVTANPVIGLTRDESAMEPAKF